MKKSLFVLTLSLVLLSADWKVDMADATLLAKEQKKYILLNFSGSDWCIPCRKLKAGLFSDSTFHRYADGCLILVNADFPNKKNALSKDQVAKNEKLADRYNPDGDFPMTLLLDTNGKVIYKWKGLIDMKPSEFVQMVENKIRPSTESK